MQGVSLPEREAWRRVVRAKPMERNMRNATHTLTIDAPKAQVFAFVSQVENLPKWATVFARAAKCGSDGRWKVATPQGEILFRIEADADSGVVDMYGGPD